MATVIYNYQVIDPSTDKYIDTNKNPLDITINVQVKLVVINDDFDAEGGVIDSSLTFYNNNITFNSGLIVDGAELVEKENYKLEEDEEDEPFTTQLRVSLGEEMNGSDIFKSFWAKWSDKCGEQGHDPKNDVTGNYFGLQIIQTFKGNSNYAGFSHTGYVFVPYFRNDKDECNRKSCRSPFFDFWDTTSKTITIKLLKFNTQEIVEKQIRVAVGKTIFEQDLENYKSQLIAQSPELILSTYDYEPNNFTKVITRLLEFQQGTLVTSLDFTRNAGLTQLYNLLGPANGIQNEIESLAGLYPSITIEDGEGIPYGDGIPGIYGFFGWGYDGLDLFSVVNKDNTSTSNYGIITLNNEEIFDTRDEFASLYGMNYFRPEDYISWGENAGFQTGDIIECTITVTDYVDDTINFVKSNYGFETDVFSSGVTITRGVNGGIYNTLAEPDWDQSVSPSGTTWNSVYNAAGGDYGWLNLDTVDDRTFGTFYDALDGAIGNNIVGCELVMYDQTVDEYWAIKFTQWTQGGNGGGFEYTRRLIDPTGTERTFKDTLVWKN